jgi:perosamine synthetase
MNHDRLALFGGKPVLDRAPAWHWPRISEADVAQVMRALRAGELSYTRKEGMVAKLEDRFCEYYRVRHALATSSGTAALHSAYFGISLAPGDEVLAPTYTYLATVMPILACNAVPVLVDADPHTGNLDPTDLERRLTPRTVAVVVTHNAGVPVDMKPVEAFARGRGLRLIEDCSHAHGARCDDQNVGTFGDAAVFSLQSKKLVPAGEGGIFLTGDREIYERALLLGHARDRALAEVTSPAYRPYATTGFGLNYRIHPLGAALACSQFDRLEATIEDRERALTALSELLNSIPGIRPPIFGRHVTRAVHYSYRPLYCPEELDGLPIDVFVDAARAEGVPLERPKARPLHYEAFFQTPAAPLRSYRGFEGRDRLYEVGDFPNSERYAKRVLRLPPYQTDAQDSFPKLAEALDKVSRNRDVLHDHARSRGGLRA